MSEIGLSLQGQFKFDLYDKEKKLLKSSDYINNFITKTGVFYPYHFAFADCFRFLSIGSGDLKNSILSIDETTGLHKPIQEFSYIGSRNNFESSESTNYSFEPSCGYNFPKENIVELYREWTLPNNYGGDSGAFQKSGVFSEFMVSPGRPYVITDDGGKLCTCDQVSGGLTGLDCSSVAEYYEWVSKKSQNLTRIENRKIRICEADKAFARIVLNSPINYLSGSTLNVTYKLSIIIDSGKKFKSLKESQPITKNWEGKLNLVQNITNPGIKLINNGQIQYKQPILGPKENRLQHYNYDAPERIYSFGKEYGESFIPPHGIPLEPSNLFLSKNKDLRNIIYYFSEDNIQFLVSPSGGSFINTGEYAPWNIYREKITYSSGNYAYSGNNTYKYINSIPNSGKSLNDTAYWENLNYLRVVDISNSGLKLFKNDIEKAINSPYSYWLNKNEFNIRRSGVFPKTGDILFDEIKSKSFYESPDLSEPAFNFDNRTGKVSYIFNFKNYSSSNNLYVKSLVAAYKDIVYPGVVSDDASYVPFFDVIFSGTGSLFAPKILTGIQDYAGGLEKTGAFISGSDSKDYFYLNSKPIYPILTNVLSWSVPCPEGASGCS